jgi:hypothetical protein
MIFGSRVEEMMARLFAALPPQSALRRIRRLRRLHRFKTWINKNRAVPARAYCLTVFANLRNLRNLRILPWRLGG